MITIFIKSYHKDFKLLKYCLMSMFKYVSGNYNVVLQVDEGDDTSILNDIWNDKIKLIFSRKVGNGYLRQQYCKLMAHKHTDSDYIMFADSDCLFYKPINVDEIIKDNKPQILFTDYSKVGDAICWKQCTEKVIGRVVDSEFMRRLPLIYHRDTLENFENFIQTDLFRLIMTSDRFSEFNAIGAYAYCYENFRYDFVNTDNWEYVEPLTIQFWSWANKHESDTHKTEYQKIIDNINKYLELNITDL